MTRFEQLYKKALNCRECALKTSGVMRTIWTKHFYALKEIINNSTIEELSKVVQG